MRGCWEGETFLFRPDSDNIIKNYHFSPKSQVNTAHVVKSTEAFKQWEYRSGKGNGQERKRRGDESPIIDDDDEDDEDEDEEERGSPVIEDATCPFKKSNEEEEDEEVSDTAC